MTVQEYTLTVSSLVPEKRDAMLSRIRGGSGYPVPCRFLPEEVRNMGLVEQLNRTELPMNEPVRF